MSEADGHGHGHSWLRPESKESVADPTRRLRQRRSRLESQLMHLDDQLQVLERFPEHDPYRDGDVIRFTLQWSSNEYTYAAIRAAGRWYTTASAGPGRVHGSWLDFVSWLTTAQEIRLFEEMVPMRTGPAREDDNEAGEAV